MLFRWFVGLNLDDAIWDVTVFTKNLETRESSGTRSASLIRQLFNHELRMALPLSAHIR
jgi:hypothetical protein